MPSSCCVVSCKSGLTSNKVKVSAFLFPKNEILRAKWIKAIPRENLVVGHKTKVCEKHFTKNQVIKTWESGNGTGKVVVCIYKL